MLVSCVHDCSLQFERCDRNGVCGEGERAAVFLHQLDVVGPSLLVVYDELFCVDDGELWPLSDFCFQL